MIKKFILGFMGVFMAYTSGFAAQTESVWVQEGALKLKGELFFPKGARESQNAQSAQGLPLVIVVHEWWGKNQYALMRGEKIADELGYAALVVDLYGDAMSTESAKQATEWSGTFYKNPTLGVNRIQAFISAALRASNRAKMPVDPNKIAAIGYCFGGTQVLNLARAQSLPENEKLLGVVSFHGGLASTLHAKDPMQTKVLVLHGESDSFVNQKEVDAFKKEMKKAHTKLTFVSYPGATHAFSNPDATRMGEKNKIPIAYNAKADAGSWKKMSAFLKGLF